MNNALTSSADGGERRCEVRGAAEVTHKLASMSLRCDLDCLKYTL